MASADGAMPGVADGIPEGSRPHVRRNYLRLCVEGGVYSGGVAFVMPGTILPPLLQLLGGPSWLIAIVPLLMGYGYEAPQLFVAHRIERLSRMKPLLIATSVFQRFPYLLAGLALMLFAGDAPVAVLALVAAAPLCAGFSSGISAAAFQDLVAKCIPANRLASLWGTRSVIAAVLGFLAGKAVERILSRWPGVVGFGLLHLFTFGFMVVSLLLFASVREPDLPFAMTARNRSWREFARAVPAMLRADPRLGALLANRFLISATSIVVPFLSLRALAVLGKPAGFLGVLLMAQMAGTIAGNLGAGAIGDRWGTHRLILAAALGYLAMCALALFARAPWLMALAYVIQGAAKSTDYVASSTFSLHLAPARERISYLSVIAGASLAGMTVMAVVNVGLLKLADPFPAQAVLTAALVAASFVAVLGMRARTTAPATAAAPGSPDLRDPS